MPLRLLVVSLLGLLPVSSPAQSAWRTSADSRLNSAIASALSYLRSEKPMRSLDLQDSLNLWQPGLGLGAQVEMTKNWTLRLDVDRYRPRFPGATGRENVDMLLLGVQYRLGGD